MVLYSYRIIWTMWKVSWNVVKFMCVCELFVTRSHAPHRFVRVEENLNWRWNTKSNIIWIQSDGMHDVSLPVIISVIVICEIRCSELNRTEIRNSALLCETAVRQLYYTKVCEIQIRFQWTINVFQS